MRSTPLRVGLVLSLVLAGCSSSPKAGAGTGPGETGVLSVQVNGLPTGTGGHVVVTGPAGFNRSLTTSTELGGLAIGAYHVTPGFVNAQGQTWTALSSPDSVYLNAGDTASVLIAYTGGPATTLDLSLAGVQLIQSSQRADGSVPMVANRDALLRVFVTANQANSAAAVVRVRLFSGGREVDSTDVTGPAAVAQSADTTSLAASWNVLIPAGRMTAGLSYQVVLDPDDLIPDTDPTDNVWPRSGTQAVAVQSVPAFSLRFVPITQSVNGLTGNVSNANKAALAQETASLWPLSAMTVDVRAAYTTSAPALDANNTSGAWGQILSETSALRASDGSSADYVSIVATNYSSGIAGLGWIGAPGAVAWDKAGSAPGVIAHELGHNFGRYHAPCGNPSGVDSAYPYPGASVGTWGLDLPALSLKTAAADKDLMSYCSPQWVSDYSYMGVLSFRGSGPAVETTGRVGPGLLVWGRVENGNVILEPAFAVTAPSRLPARPGPEQVEGFDASGGRLFSLSFKGQQVADLPSGAERQFAFVVPLGAADQSRLVSLRLTAGGMTALRTPLAQVRGMVAGGGAPTARRVNGLTEVRWNTAAPMALIRDAETGQILSFARGGVARVVAGPGGVIVELSEGVSSAAGVKLVAP
ncbi:MAG TPA: M12 family metallo-peptidase [Gemmatimonadales bacterium]|nr:M12 family metallo-peptidase [Gemmatimonadales bacterium]